MHVYVQCYRTYKALFAYIISFNSKYNDNIQLFFSSSCLSWGGHCGYSSSCNVSREERVKKKRLLENIFWYTEGILKGSWTNTILSMRNAHCAVYFCLSGFGSMRTSLSFSLFICKIRLTHTYPDSLTKLLWKAN